MKYAELTDAQKAKARDWFRAGRESDWYESVYDDAVQVAQLLGISIGCKTSKGGRSVTPSIYFSGFSSQGDGCCFEGDYRYAPKECVIEYAPQDAKLKRIAEGLEELQQRFDLRLTATITHRGHYYHSGCMDIDVDLKDDEDISKPAAELRDWLRAFADWIYGQLCEEDEYQDSDEHVVGAIEANDYDFDVGTGGIRI